MTLRGSEDCNRLGTKQSLPEKIEKRNRWMDI